MHKPLHLLAAVCCALVSYGQKTDTLVIFYKSDQYTISKQEKQKLDSFLLGDWDRLSICGYTDETDDEDYNLELSKRRSGEVYQYFMDKKIGAAITSQFVGESMPKADNGTEEGKALNRRTEIIGYRYARVQLKPKDDPMKPVTQTLDNGFIITYRPGGLPGDMANNFAAGSGIDFQVITNTVEMRQNNLFNNTTNGEILSSVLIFCAGRMNPCKLDSPILIKVPIPFQIKCPVTKVKFFNAVVENGRRIWEEESRQLCPEIIDGRQYVGVWMDDFCQCINFDFKIDPECFDTDSTQLQYVNTNVRDLTAELKGLNSVYLPRKIGDSTYRILHLKEKLDEAVLSFSLYNGKRRIRGFKDKRLNDFPYDSATGQYILSTATQKLHFPRLNVWDVVLNVNGDRYRVPEDKNSYDFIYLKHKTDSILVDFTIFETKKRMTQYRNQPLKSLRYDAAKGSYVIDKDFIKELKQKASVTGL